MKLNEIKQFDLTKALKINSNIDIEEKNIDGLTYVIIDNFLENPEYFISFIKQFPTDHTYGLLEDHYKTNTDCPFIKPVGIQQLLPNSYFELLSFTLYKLLIETNYVPENNSEKIHNHQKLSSIVRSFVYYTNVIFPNMVCNKNADLPHIDQFDYSFNIHLSDDDIGGGLSFYKLLFKNQYYNSVEDIMNLDDVELKSSIADTLNLKCAISDKIVKYEKFNDTDLFVKYHTIPYKFNRLIIHKGSSWHNIEYNPEIETADRYSFVGYFTESK